MCAEARTSEHPVPEIHPSQIVDTVGAGDSFAGGVCAVLCGAGVVWCVLCFSLGLSADCDCLVCLVLCIVVVVTTCSVEASFLACASFWHVWSCSWRAMGESSWIWMRA